MSVRSQVLIQRKNLKEVEIQRTFVGYDLWSGPLTLQCPVQGSVPRSPLMSVGSMREGFIGPGSVGLKLVQFARTFGVAWTVPPDLRVARVVKGLAPMTLTPNFFLHH